MVDDASHPEVQTEFVLGEDAETATVHHTPLSRKTRRPGRVGQLNLTAMIDVIFLLLIYFVVTSNFRIDEGVLTATLPQGEGKPQATTELPPQKVEVLLTAGVVDDTQVAIQVGSQAFTSFAELRQDLANKLYDPEAGQLGGLYEADNPIIIQPGVNVRWQHVVDAFNACVAAKYTNVIFAKPQ
ncbi:MAG: biopolymer transporter ExbD [Planctomycetota bacterium]